jgi:hypothetical protein
MSNMGPDEIHASARQCPACGAELLARATRCWLCRADLTPAVDGAGQSSAPAAPPPTAPRARGGGFSLASLMLFITLAAVVMGVSSLASGIGIPMGIVLLVVWLRTTAVVKFRVAHGKTVTRAENFHLFLASFGATLGLLAVTCIAGCAAFVAACFACVGTWSLLGADRVTGAEMVVAWLVFAIVISVIAIPVLVWIAKFIRRRWRRDVGSDEESP